MSVTASDLQDLENMVNLWAKAVLGETAKFSIGVFSKDRKAYVASNMTRHTQCEMWLAVIEGYIEQDDRIALSPTTGQEL